jgi:hypothetical protein
LLVTEPNQAAKTRTVRGAVVAAIALTAAAAATGTILLTTGGKSPAAAQGPTAAQAAHQRDVETGRALNVSRSSQKAVRRPQLRLGILAAPADSTGLAAAGLGYIAAKLSPSGTDVTYLAYTTSAAEAEALAAGAIDAAYIPPDAAVIAWQRTQHAIRIVAGADQTTSGAPAVVLVIRAAYLSSHPSQTTDLLQGDIQATTLMIMSPAVGLPAARAELEMLTRHKITKATTAAFGRYRSSNNPHQSDIAVAGGSSAASLFDLTVVNSLLRASGLAPAT